MTPLAALAMAESDPREIVEILTDKPRYMQKKMIELARRREHPYWRFPTTKNSVIVYKREWNTKPSPAASISR